MLKHFVSRMGLSHLSPPDVAKRPSTERWGTFTNSMSEIQKSRLGGGGTGENCSPSISGTFLQDLTQYTPQVVPSRSRLIEQYKMVI